MKSLIVVDVLAWLLTLSSFNLLSRNNVLLVRAEVSLDCDPCIQRDKYKLRGIFHGEILDPFWQQVEAAAVQSAKDMGVDLEITLYDEFDPLEMANDIRALISDDGRPDALIVTIPAEVVESAVIEVIQAGMPVFGFNSGYQAGSEAGVLAWVAQDEYIAGRFAAEKFLEEFAAQQGTGAGSVSGNVTSPVNTVGLTNALFINHEKGNSGLEDRLKGYSDVILEKTGVVVEELVVDGALDDEALTQNIRPAFTGCPYDMVLLASSRTMELTLTAFDGLFADCTGQTLLGSFDESPLVYEGIEAGKVVFGISQQQHLQGILPVLLATLYVTTGRLPATPLQGGYGVYLSGPSLITADNVPSSTRQVCTVDAFPQCPNTLVPGRDPNRAESQCPCTDRDKIKIGGVVHGVSTDSFWDPVFAAAALAASDMGGVDLDFHRFEPQETDEVLHLKMANKISSLCEEGVNGIFVSIPSDAVVEAIQACVDKGIPVISINAGAETSVELGLVHHIGQLEYNAGYSAAKLLIEEGMVKGWCLNHEPSTSTLAERCAGMEAAIAEADGVEYGGEVVVPRDNDARYSIDVELAIDDTGEWEGYGILLTGQVQITPATSLLKEHPKVLIGTFDISDDVFSGLGSKLIKFGIDQQPFLQGYMPIPLLTYLSYSGQKLANGVVESGPNFVLSPPSEEQQICEVNFYEVCQRDSGESKSDDSGNSSGGSLLTSAVSCGIACVSSALLLM